MIKRRILKFNTRRNEGSETTTQKDEGVEWEMRPGGMLVQKRTAESCVVPPPNLRVRVEYGDIRIQISTNSQSNFGALKKLLTAETGLQPDEQRLTFRGKERRNGEYLDTCGVKERSRIILTEDPVSKERKVMETRRNAKILAAHHLMEEVSGEVDSLAAQVCIIEKSIASGKKVAELQITTLIEMLMRQAVKLENIPTECNDACANRDPQCRRVQKCVEILDHILLVKAAESSKDKNVSVESVNTKCEIFDSSPLAIQWELFD